MDDGILEARVKSGLTLEERVRTQEVRMEYISKQLEDVKSTLEEISKALHTRLPVSVTIAISVLTTVIGFLLGLVRSG